jgi:polyhydroxybutyrate depolymerase
MNVSVESLEIMGDTRFFLLAAPANVPAGTKLPLVLVLHGDGEDGPAMRAAMPLDMVSGTAAYVVYPTGADKTWNLYAPMAQNSDMQFITSIVTSLGSRFSVDPQKVFATGFSSGAFMVNQLACRQPSLFRAIASQSGGSPEEPNDPTASHWQNGYTRCASQELGGGPAALVVHGTADATVDYESGAFTAVYWAFINECSTSESSDKQDCVRYDGCPTTHPVVFCSVPDMGHDLWAEAPTTIWSFFSAI